MPSGNDTYDGVERSEEPHAMSDFEQVDKDDRAFAEIMSRRTRITRADLDKYGFTDGCPRCEALRAGAPDTTKHHSEDCRFRIYDEWETSNDPKWMLLGKQLEKHYPKDEIREGEIDAEGHQRLPEVLAEESRDMEVREQVTNHEPDTADAPSMADDPLPSEPMSDDGPPSLVDDDDTPTLEQVSDIMIDALTLAGVRERTAREYASAAVRHERDSPTCVEVYGRGNIVAAANGPHKSLNVEGLSALDLAITKSNGEHWDFSRRSHRDAARKMVAGLEPTWLIGSPPCTAFSSWQYVNYALLPPEEVERKKTAGLVHLKLVAQLYKQNK